MTTHQRIIYKLGPTKCVFHQPNEELNVQFLIDHFKLHKADQGLDNFMELLRPEHRESIYYLAFNVQKDDLKLRAFKDWEPEYQNIALELIATEHPEIAIDTNYDSDAAVAFHYQSLFNLTFHLAAVKGNLFERSCQIYQQYLDIQEILNDAKFLDLCKQLHDWSLDVAGIDDIKGLGLILHYHLDSKRWFLGDKYLTDSLTILENKDHWEGWWLSTLASVFNFVHGYNGQKIFFIEPSTRVETSYVHEKGHSLHSYAIQYLQSRCVSAVTIPACDGSCHCGAAPLASACEVKN